MEQIKIYTVNRDFMSPFADDFSEEYLRNRGIVFTKNPLSADVIMASSSGSRKYKLMKNSLLHKKFVVWTNEPRHSTSYKNFVATNEITMNVYSGDVFMHNLHFLGSYHYNFSVDLGIDLHAPAAVPLTPERLREKSKFCAAIFSYRDPEKSKLLIHDKDVDLNGHRQSLAYFLYKVGKADIFGSDWPGPVEVTASFGYETGNDSWWVKKIDFLKQYKFNICFENTIVPYYCTEKIWHAIAGGCLPIYYGGGTRIYETFPQNSFIDAAEFKTNEDLLHFLENISDEEHINRYNMCLDVMHRACAERLANQQLKTDIIEEYVKKIQLLVGHHNRDKNKIMTSTGYTKTA